jgi:hypothetical protein
LPQVLTILAWPSVQGAGLGIGGTAAHDCRQHRELESSL